MGLLDIFRIKPATGEALDALEKVNNGLDQAARVAEVQADFTERLFDRYDKAFAERDALIVALLAERDGGPRVDPALIRNAKIHLQVSTVAEAWAEYKKERGE